jgi:hypothetical protein
MAAPPGKPLTPAPEEVLTIAPPLAPARANASAVARPMPLAASVTNATLPVNCPSSLRVAAVISAA